MLSKLTGKGASGFTLPEVMLAMGMSSLIMLAVAQLLPLLRAQTQDSASLIRLEQLLGQTLFGIEKDIRRAGFCAGRCQGSALTLEAGAMNQVSCLSVAYDVNRNGRWETGEQPEPEFFSYRLRDGALEVQTGGPRCQGNRWEKLLDPSEVTIARFEVTKETPGVQPRYRVLLEGYWTARPTRRRQVNSLVTGRNHAG
ncbi:prepilin peptidase-dependent protein [Dickeya dianthicola]|uniref:prepilin peptidase-dependent protein n=1 Tax=Dickeya dianthicola TaxID=204039 RepID=UPI000401486D|nr:prepilin peptidase-dependent protein [Dickeya dianthicola]MCI4185194.1 prepilin peptidase-dependent protein [Dickeya dianthicola]MCI4201607.1 prepilin peptidase-dependent protein [Dickeya dianthicola]MCI4212313.1 prepilin peptidase-dependent protein [Dickeya dianthicola]MCI4223871.1 prepilin peptidase-dependent protein [Dickeya dianthicola]MCI4232223.1 prepilin peptidase-dependent protein [Dickeya dianthicola]